MIDPELQDAPAPKKEALRKKVGLTGMYTIFDHHDFDIVNFSAPHHCDCCLQLLWPSGLECLRCGVQCHKECASTVRNTKCLKYDLPSDSSTPHSSSPSTTTTTTEPTTTISSSSSPQPAASTHTAAIATPAGGTSPTKAWGIKPSSSLSSLSASTSSLGLSSSAGSPSSSWSFKISGSPTAAASSPTNAGAASSFGHSHRSSALREKGFLHRGSTASNLNSLAAADKALSSSSPNLPEVAGSPSTPTVGSPVTPRNSAVSNAPPLSPLASSSTTIPSPPLPPSATPSAPEEPPKDEETKKREKMARMRASSVNEILTSEQKYVDDLKLFIETYIRPMMNDKQLPTFNRRDVQIVFSTIELIYQGNAEFLEEMKGFMTSEPDLCVSKTFMTIEDRLQYYSVFCNHQEESRVVIEGLIQSSSYLRSFLDRIRDQLALGFFDFYIKPFQRLLKYPLLLREVLRHTPETHPDFENIKKAFTSLQVVVDRIHFTVAHKENMHKLVMFMDSIQGLTNFTKAERQFMRDGDFTKLSTKLISPKRHLALFNDVLLVTKPLSKGKYVLKHNLSITDAAAGPLTAEMCEREGWKRKTDFELVFILEDLKGHKKWPLIAKTEQECQAWIKAIEAQAQLMRTFSSGRQNSSAASSSTSTTQATVTAQTTEPQQPAQQQQSQHMGPSGGKIRVYYNPECFKTFDIDMKMNAGQWVKQFGKKFAGRRPPTAPEVDSLILWNEGHERQLDPSEVPLEIQTNLISSGLAKFGGMDAHFRVIFDAPKPEEPIESTTVPATTTPTTTTTGEEQVPTELKPEEKPTPQEASATMTSTPDSMTGSVRAPRPSTNKRPSILSSAPPPPPVPALAVPSAAAAPASELKIDAVVAASAPATPAVPAVTKPIAAAAPVVVVAAAPVVSKPLVAPVVAAKPTPVVVVKATASIVESPTTTPTTTTKVTVHAPLPTTPAVKPAVTTPAVRTMPTPPVKTATSPSKLVVPSIFSQQTAPQPATPSPPPPPTPPQTAAPSIPTQIPNATNALPRFLQTQSQVLATSPTSVHVFPRPTTPPTPAAPSFVAPSPPPTEQTIAATTTPATGAALLTLTRSASWARTHPSSASLIANPPEPQPPHN